MNRYYLAMQTRDLLACHPGETVPADGKAAFRAALGIAFVLHVLLLLTPASRRSAPVDEFPGHFRMRVITSGRPTQTPPGPMPESGSQSLPRSGLETTPETRPALPPVPRSGAAGNDNTRSSMGGVPPAKSAAQTTPARPATGIPDTAGQAHLTSTLLARQFISERPSADPLFGPEPGPDDHRDQRAFRFPERVDMRALLNRPLPELPFKYTPGLIYFAYQPGVRGELQRFWDDITPEFGWTTRHGTEVKCVWALVIVACGWK